MDKIEINYDRESIYIKLPIELLVFAQRENPDCPSLVTDEEKMTEYFKERFLDFGDDGESESRFYTLIDSFFYDALESGEEWLTGMSN